MNPPEIYTSWRHKHFSDEIITIVPARFSNSSRKNIVYQYHRTKHIGGCNSAEWFYEDWIPLS